MAATLQGFLQNCMTEHVVVHFLFHKKTSRNLLFFLIFEKIRRFFCVFGTRIAIEGVTAQ